jgi:hypothetical protein
VKVFQLLLVLGGILFIAGIYVIYPGTPYTSNHTVSIPSGGNYFFQLGMSIQKGGHVGGTFSELSGNTIVLYLFNQAQYDSYRNGPVSGSMFQTSGISGSFSANVPSPGTYYIVLEHGASSVNQVQNVQVSYVIDGMNPVYLVSGLGLLAAGIILAVLGYARKRKVVPPRSVTDVVMFDHPKPADNPQI